MSLSEHFRRDNTEGYDAADLAALNAAWTRITAHGAPGEDEDDIGVRSMLNHWGEQLLAAYDAGRRGDDLVAWFYQ
jgi:hypothetical protein